MAGYQLRLSQCMIVKDEEENIEKALSWGKDIVWEQIVVDTGSTDRTVELAEAMGAKVYHFKWIDDFAAAKNFAIEQASGDWVAFLDADEYVKEEDIPNILPLLQKADQAGLHAVRVALISIDRENNIQSALTQTRFFRRMKELRYYGSVHEQLRLSMGDRLDRYRLDDTEMVTVYHTGYDPQEMQKKQKFERNYRLLQKELEKNPNDYHVMGDIGDLYKPLEGKEEDAAHWYWEAVRKMPPTPAVQSDRNIKTFVSLMEIVADQKDEQKLLELYEGAKRRFTGVYDTDYIMGRFYVKEKKDYRKGIRHLQQAMQTFEKYGTANYGPMMIGNLSEFWEMLAECSYHLGQLNDCVAYSVGLLKMDKSRTAALDWLLRAFSAENPQSVLQFLSRLYDFSAAEELAYVQQSCQRTDSLELLRLLKRLG